MSNAEMHGVPLIERVIAKVEREGLRGYDVPALERPQGLSAGILERLRFPGGERPSPSLLRWLAFDATWLAARGWFNDPTAPDFTPLGLGEFVAREYGEHYGEQFAPLEGHVPGQLYLLPQGSDSRRALYVGAADSTGEHPVLVTDMDDGAFVGIMFPGFDIYMADLAGVIDLGKQRSYTGLRTHPEYGARFAEHMAKNLAGRASIDFEAVQATEEPIPYTLGDPVPDGYRVAIDPFTKVQSLVRK